MIRPSLALWDKSYKEEMLRWVKWHVDNSTIDNLDEFMRGFMKFSRGTVNPQMVKEVWEFTKGVERMTKYHASTKEKFMRVIKR